MIALISTPWWITAVVVVVSFLCLIWNSFRKHLESKKPFDSLPMPPNSHWFFGQLFNIGGDFLVSQPRLAREYCNEYGQTGYFIVRTKAISVTSHEDARAILNHSNFRRPLPLFRRHVDQFLGPRNIGFLNGKEWKFHRTSILRAFTPTAVHNAQTSILQVVARLIKSLREKQLQQQQEDDEPIQMDIGALMKMITIDVFGQTALSQDLGCCSKLEPSPIAVAFDFMGKEMSRRIFQPSSILDSFYWIPTPKNRQYQRERKLIRTFLFHLIQDRLRNPTTTTATTAPPKDLLQGLLDQRITTHQDESTQDSTKTKKSANPKNNHQTLAQQSEDTISDVLMALLFAGYDTTSITLTYALYHIATNPIIEQQCLAEITNPLVDPTNPDQLLYCKAVILETLRLFPPGIITSRSMEKPLKISGNFVIPTDTVCFIPIWTIHRMEEHFERPTEFIPQRWAYQDSEGLWHERLESQDDDTSPPPLVSKDNTGTTAALSSTNEESKSKKTTTPKTTPTPTNAYTPMIAPANRKAFFAFSGGARSCAGSKFAMTEAVLILAQLVQHFKLELSSPKEYELRPVRVGLVQCPRDAMMMTMKWRMQ